MNCQISIGLIQIDIPPGPGTPFVTIAQVLGIGATSGFSALPACSEEEFEASIKFLKETLMEQPDVPVIVLVQDHPSPQSVMKLLHMVSREQTTFMYAAPHFELGCDDTVVFALAEPFKVDGSL